MINLVQKQLLEVFYKETVLKGLTIFTEKHLYWNFLLIKLQASVSASDICKYQWQKQYSRDVPCVPLIRCSKTIHKILKETPAMFLYENPN